MSLIGQSEGEEDQQNEEDTEGNEAQVQGWIGGQEDASKGQAKEEREKDRVGEQRRQGGQRDDAEQFEDIEEDGGQEEVNTPQGSRD